MNSKAHKEHKQIIKNVILAHKSNELYWREDTSLVKNIRFFDASTKDFNLSLLRYSNSCSLLVYNKLNSQKIGHYCSIDFPELKTLLIPPTDWLQEARSEKLKMLLKDSIFYRIEKFLKLLVR